MKRALIVLTIVTLALVPASVSAKGNPHRIQPLAAAASVGVSDPVIAGQPATWSWTGGDGGFIRIDDQCRLTYISTGFGDGSFTDYQPDCPGAATLQLLSSTGTSDAPVVLAEVAYTVQ